MPSTSKSKSHDSENPKQKIIAVDFDGTIAKRGFPGIGDPIWGTINKVRSEHENGTYIIIWTCRTGEKLEEMKVWLKEHEVPYDAINENAPWMLDQFDGQSRKIFANEYWDDRAREVETILSGPYQEIGREVGAHVDLAQKAYGDSFGQAQHVLRAFMYKYRNPDGTYTIPDSLIPHLLTQIRIIDKQFRIFSNPEEDLMGESPYHDIAGYGILGEGLSRHRRE